ncbi:hypothetical protein GE21DRAFT_1215193, partial [Neurospora crassa]
LADPEEAPPSHALGTLANDTIFPQYLPGQGTPGKTGDHRNPHRPPRSLSQYPRQNADSSPGPEARR